MRPWRFEIKIAFISSCILLSIFPLIISLFKINSILGYIIYAVFSFSVVFFITKRIVDQKIGAMNEVFKHLLQEHPNTKVPRGVDDGFGDLFNFLGDLVDKFEQRTNEYRLNQVRLEAVFAGMPEGVLVVDGENHIRLINRSLSNMFDIKENILGKTPLEAIHIYDVKEITQNILNKTIENEEREISIVFPQDKILKIYAAAIQPDGAVLIFHDITQLRHLERVRRDFVANVSHELRTPVSTIKGYAETLLDGAIDDKEHALEFLEIIKADSNRLSLLINDLLDLSRVESGVMPVNLTKVHVDVLTKKVISKLSKFAQDNSVSLFHKNLSNSLICKIDENLMEQVLINLIENAIKYNRPNGEVYVDAKIAEGKIQISVADTGMGIPHEELSRIFERFYRVDKAHSSHLGGTGLGLSIVKHIVQLHHGEVTVQSEMGRGSTFTVILPLQ